MFLFCSFQLAAQISVAEMGLLCLFLNEGGGTGGRGAECAKRDFKCFVRAAAPRCCVLQKPRGAKVDFNSKVVREGEGALAKRSKTEKQRSRNCGGKERERQILKRCHA